MSQQQNAPDPTPEHPAQPAPGPVVTTEEFSLPQDGHSSVVHAPSDSTAGRASRPASARGEATPPDPSRLQKPASADHVHSQTPSRYIAMQTILNPSNASVELSSRQSSREPPGSPTSVSASPSTQLIGSPSPIARPPLHSEMRSYSDNSYVLASPQGRRILTPKSPALRAASSGARLNPVPGTINVTQAPFLQSPRPRSFSGETPSTRINVETATATVPSRSPYGRAPLHAGSFFPEHYPSSRPHSQDTSPSTPHSMYGPPGQTSPGSAQSYLQQAQPVLPPPPPLPQSGRQGGELGHPLSAHESGSLHRGEGSFPTEAHLPLEGGQAMIPITIDVESGSRRAGMRRNRNRRSSKGHRERKKASEAQNAQDLEEQKERVRDLTNEVDRWRAERDFLRDERDFYHAERDFFRDELRSRIPSARVPPRPLSPRHRHPLSQTSHHERGQAWSHLEADAEGLGRNVRPRLGPGPPMVSHAAATLQSGTTFIPPPSSPYHLPHASWMAAHSTNTQSPTGVPQPHLQPTTHPPPGPSAPHETPLPPRSQSSKKRPNEGQNPGP